MMKKWMIIFLLCCIPSLYAADSWLPSALQIPEGTSAGVAFDVNLAYDAANKTTIAAWADTNTKAPYYSVFDGTNWLPAAGLIPPGTSSEVLRNVTLTYNEANGTVVASWTNFREDAPSNEVYYSIFDGTNWLPAAELIPLGTSFGSLGDVALTYDAANGTVIAAWSSFNGLYYSIFNGTDWITTDVIPLGTSSGALNNVALTYDAANGTVIAAWVNSSTNAPYYSVFNGTDWITTDVIPLGTSSGGLYDVELAYNAANGTVIAAWGDSSTNAPYYSVFNGTNWLPAAGLIPNGTGAGVYQNISLAYDSDSRSIFAAWQDIVVGNGIPYYSIFNESSWSVANEIPSLPSSGVDFNVNMSYDPHSHQMIAAWGNYPDNSDPFYSLYLTFEPPLGLQGVQLKNVFLAFKDIYNHLQWQPSPSTSVTGYRVYRNGSLIASLDATTLHYNDHNRKKGVPTVYSVTAVDSQGNESVPTSVTVQ